MKPRLVNGLVSPSSAASVWLRASLPALEGLLPPKLGVDWPWLLDYFTKGVAAFVGSVKLWPMIIFKK